MRTMNYHGDTYIAIKDDGENLSCTGCAFDYELTSSRGVGCQLMDEGIVDGYSEHCRSSFERGQVIWIKES